MHFFDSWTTSGCLKVVRACGILYIFISTCASRQNNVHFFGISTSKSAPKLRCFAIFTSKCASRLNGVHFFDISTSKSRSNVTVFDTFYFQMCFAHFRTTTACAFSTSQLRKCSGPEVFCAFRLQNVGVHFFILFQHLNFQKWSGAEVFCTF